MTGREEPEKKENSPKQKWVKKGSEERVRLTRAELEKVMLERASSGDPEAEEWLISNGYELAERR